MPARPRLDHADAVRRDARQRALLGPLQRLAIDFRGRVRSGLRARRHALEPAHASVLVHLPAQGARVTELARRAGISKQAMAKRVGELAAVGYVEQVPDPEDGRAKRVRFSRKGLGLLRDARAAVDEAWADYAELVGERRLAGLRDELFALWAAVDGAGQEARKP